MLPLNKVVINDEPDFLAWEVTDENMPGLIEWLNNNAKRMKNDEELLLSDDEEKNNDEELSQIIDLLNKKIE